MDSAKMEKDFLELKVRISQSKDLISKSKLNYRYYSDNTKLPGFDKHIHGMTSFNELIDAYSYVDNTEEREERWEKSYKDLGINRISFNTNTMFHNEINGILPYRWIKDIKNRILVLKHEMMLEKYTVALNHLIKLLSTEKQYEYIVNSKASEGFDLLEGSRTGMINHENADLEKHLVDVCYINIDE